jgi:hypothetical protein
VGRVLVLNTPPALAHCRHASVAVRNAVNTSVTQGHSYIMNCSQVVLSMSNCRRRNFVRQLCVILAD